MKPTFVLLNASLALALCACGSDSNSNRAPDVLGASGVSASKPLSMLTDDEERLFCELEIDSYYDGLTEHIFCIGYTNAEHLQYCASDYDACVASDNYESALAHVSVCGEDVLINEYGDCTATVLELEACIKDIYKEVHDFYRDMTCATFEEMPLGKPASCTALHAKCPELR